MQLERNGEDFSIHASLLSDLLNVPSSCIQDLMRQKEITGLCERGEGEHEGQYRLTFFYKGRRARLSVDEIGSGHPAIDRRFRRPALAIIHAPIQRSLTGPDRKYGNATSKPAFGDGSR